MTRTEELEWRERLQRKREARESADEWIEELGLRREGMNFDGDTTAFQPSPLDDPTRIPT